MRVAGYAVLCRIIGLRIRVDGEISRERPLLLVSNHISYLDIFVLGWKTTACFTPKSEVAGWAVVSTICRLLDCVFIERRSAKIKSGGNDIKTALASGEIVSLFPEGTTGNGRHPLPFKSSLLSIAEEKIDGKELWIQPAVIRYTHIGQLPIDSTQWPSIAWYGDMLLAPHLWELLKLPKIDATLTLLPAVTCAQLGNRKQLTAHLQQATSDILATSS